MSKNHKIEEEFEEIQATHDLAKEDGPIAGISQATFDELTNRNQQFLLNIDRVLVEELRYEVRTEVYQEMAPTLLEAQKTGTTARQLYGTPTEVIETVLEQNIEPDGTNASGEPSSFFLLGVDGALLLGSVFVFLTGLSMWRQGLDGSTVPMGVLTMILNYVVAGVAMALVSTNIPDPDAPKGEKGYLRYFALSTLGMLLWFVTISFSSAIFPPMINPVLSGEIYMVIGALTFALRFVVKNHYNIEGSIF